MGKSQSKLTPEQISELQNSTHFNQQELKARYKDFMRDYPDGRIDRKEFERFHERFFPSGDPRQFVEYIFSVFDCDQNGTIDFKEFICPLSLTSRGNPDDKLKWVFSVYDIDQNGTIAYDEMLRIVESFYKMVGQTAELPENEDTPKKRVDKIFDSMDKDKDSRLTYEEFAEGSKQDSAIAKALSLYGGLV